MADPIPSPVLPTFPLSADAYASWMIATINQGNAVIAAGAQQMIDRGQASIDNLKAWGAQLASQAAVAAPTN